MAMEPGIKMAVNLSEFPLIRDYLGQFTQIHAVANKVLLETEMLISFCQNKKTDYLKKSIKFTGSKLWNSLPLHYICSKLVCK